jgi:5-methylcytosine-specific restriction endonuclease McrA
MALLLYQRAKAWLCGRSSQWPAVRRAYLADHPFCAACGGRVELEVHHVTPVHITKNQELNPGNLIALCEASDRLCHFRIGHLFQWHSWNTEVRQDAASQLARISRRP